MSRTSFVSTAAVLAALTLASRLLGFGRWLVFSKTVGDTCLGDVYTATNKLPNVLFEVVAGGVLAGVVVPVVARHLGAGRQTEAARTTSALFGWTLLVLTPAAMIALVGAPLYARTFVSASCDGGVAVGTALLMIFAPQIWLYGLAVVAAGVLQAHHRFVAAALAPLLSAVVVILGYLIFAAVAPTAGVDDPSRLSATSVAVLGWGTTAGVVVLAATTVIPLGRVGVRLRPTLRFAAGDAGQIGRIAGAGVTGLVAQQLTTLLAIWVAQRSGDPGAVTRNEWANAIYLLPYAVLVAPLLQVVFPRLTQVADHGWTATADTLRAVGRPVVVLAGLGAAVLAATAVPVARVFVLGPGSGRTEALAWPIAAFAPAVLGFSLLGLANRVLLSHRLARATGTMTVTAWLVVAAGVGLTAALDLGTRTVTAIAAATSVGMIVGAVVGWLAIRRAAGDVRFGLGRTLAAVLPLTVVVGALVGWPARAAADLALVPALLAALAAAAAATLLYGGTVLVVDRGLLRDVLALRRRRPAPEDHAPGGRR
ncbi:MAG: murein biosynthesis integral membrane protein MurJ [Propionibacteriaceae bacterium]